MSNKERADALNEAEHCFAELHQIMGRALNEAIQCGAPDLVECITTAKAAAKRGAHLLAQLREMLLGGNAGTENL